MGIKLNSSMKLNKEFANQVSAMSIEMGIEIHVARNIIRFRRSLRNKKNNTSWTDPKTGLVLDSKQWTSPSLRIANQIKNGTVGIRPSAYVPDWFEVSQPPEVTYSDALDQGMLEFGAGILWDKHDVSMNIAQTLIENRQPWMKHQEGDEYPQER